MKRRGGGFHVAKGTIHWRAPAVMLLALTTGLGFAVGHQTHSTAQPAFASMSCSNLESLLQSYKGSGYVTASPSQFNIEVDRIANAVAASGAILPIPSPGLNASWRASFEAPRLRCEDMNATTREKVRSNFLAILSSIDQPDVGLDMFTYVGWDSPGENISVPFVRDASGWGMNLRTNVLDEDYNNPPVSCELRGLRSMQAILCLMYHTKAHSLCSESVSTHPLS